MEKGMHPTVPAHQISTYSSLAGALGHYVHFTNPPESLEPKVKRLTGQRLPILKECDEVKFVAISMPVTVKAVLGGVSPCDLIWQDSEIVLRGAPGRLIELRMLYPQYPHSELSICFQLRSATVTRAVLLWEAAMAIKKLHGKIQEINKDERHHGLNYHSVPDPHNLEILKLQDMGRQGGSWNIVVAERCSVQSSDYL